MKTKKLICSVCGVDFEKPMNEYKRRRRLGKTKFYCSLKCSGNRPSNIKLMQEVGKPNHFVGGENRLITQEQKLLSSMGEFIRRAAKRPKYFVEGVTTQMLVDIWNNQNGRCAYTGVELVHPRMKGYKKVSNNFKASIDRIDSNKPYSADNIQFVSATVNFMKHDMTERETYEFLDIVRGTK